LSSGLERDSVKMFSPISKIEFLTRFHEQVYDRLGGVDPYEERKYKELKTLVNLEYFEGFLEKSDLEILILPHHATEIEHGRQPDRVVKAGGHSFYAVINDFLSNYIPDGRFPKTVAKVLDLKTQFFKSGSATFDANFIFISNDRTIAHDETHYDASHGRGKLFLGNGFHRLVAYGLAIEQQVFKPLKVHLVKTTVSS